MMGRWVRHTEGERTLILSFSATDTLTFSEKGLPEGWVILMGRPMLRLAQPTVKGWQCALRSAELANS